MRVELMSHSGDDLLVVNAARASFGKESQLEGKVIRTTTSDSDGNYIGFREWGLSDRDKKLLDYLAREKHILPFRHPQITLRIKVPIFLARQLGKHQVGMSWSEESRRYVTTEPEFFWPDKWRKAAENVKQGSSDEEVTHVKHYAFSVFENGESTPKYEDVTPEKLAKSAAMWATSIYDELIKGGVAPELARTILPQNMYITAVWTGSLLSFYQMYKLRSEEHAQKEARDFAEMVKEKIAPLYPESWAALEKHV